MGSGEGPALIQLLKDKIAGYIEGYSSEQCSKESDTVSDEICAVLSDERKTADGRHNKKPM